MSRRHPKRAPLTPALIAAATLDAGNRSMTAAGRMKWGRADYNAASIENNRLWDLYEDRS